MFLEEKMPRGEGMQIGDVLRKPPLETPEGMSSKTVENYAFPFNPLDSLVGAVLMESKIKKPRKLRIREKEGLQRQRKGCRPALCWCAPSNEADTAALCVGGMVVRRRIEWSHPVSRCFEGERFITLRSFVNVTLHRVVYGGSARREMALPIDGYIIQVQ